MYDAWQKKYIRACSRSIPAIAEPAHRRTARLAQASPPRQPRSDRVSLLLLLLLLLLPLLSMIMMMLHYCCSYCREMLGSSLLQPSALDGSANKGVAIVVARVLFCAIIGQNMKRVH